MSATDNQVKVQALMTITMTDRELEALIGRAVATALSEARPSRIAFSPVEAAEMLGVSRNHFDTWILRRLTYTRSGKRILIPLDELRRYMTGRRS